MIRLLATAVVLVVGARLLRRGLVVVDVRGDSMEPGLRSGDRVLARRGHPARLRPGDLVVFEWPDEAGSWQRPPLGRARPDGRGWLIKRVVAVAGQRTPAGSVPGADGGRVPTGTLVVVGDNQRRSFDSRRIGFIPHERILGVAVGRVAPREHRV